MGADICEGHLTLIPGYNPEIYPGKNVLNLEIKSRMYFQDNHENTLIYFQGH
jgi:hypothetical protein